MKKLFVLFVCLVFASSISFAAKQKKVKSAKKNIKTEKKVQVNRELDLALSAAEEGDFNTTKYLFETSNLYINDKDENNQTLLMKACCSSNLDLVKYLLDKKANITMVDNFNYDALMYAVERSNADIVQELFNSSIDINTLTTDQFKLLNLAINNKDFRVIRYLIEAQNFDAEDPTLLLLSAKAGNLDVFKYLLNNKGLDSNVKDDNNNTLLMYAVKGGNIDIVKYLVNITSVDIDEVNNDNKKAKDVAIENNQIEIAKFLTQEK